VIKNSRRVQILKMWYTTVIALDVFLVWWITNGLLSVFASLMGWTEMIAAAPAFLDSYGVPAGFVSMLGYLPHGFLFGFYMMYSLPESVGFRTWGGWKYMREEYFQTKVLYPFEEDRKESQEPDRDYQALYAVCPHGVYACGAVFYFLLNSLYLNVVTASTSLLFWIPIVREFTCLSGAIPANTAGIVAALDEGKSLVMLPEGLRGLLHLHQTDGTDRVLRGNTAEGSRPRKGFIRCALTSKRHASVRIVPVYIHGHDALYSVHMTCPGFQSRLLAKYLYPWPVLAWGAWWLPFWPRSTPLTVVMGPAIAVEGEVDDIHEEYCKAIEELRNWCKSSLRE